MKQIKHWKCSVCGRQLTYIDSEDDLPSVSHHVHFDVSRSNKELYVEDFNIEENARNTKMEMQLCEDCFNRVLNESSTLAKIFDTHDGRIY